jgi:hypothetical protein
LLFAISRSRLEKGNNNEPFYHGLLLVSHTQAKWQLYNSLPEGVFVFSIGVFSLSASSSCCRKHPQLVRSGKRNRESRHHFSLPCPLAIVSVISTVFRSTDWTLSPSLVDNVMFNQHNLYFPCMTEKIRP